MKYLIFFLMLPHLKPSSFEALWPALESLFNAGRLASALAIVGLHIYKGKIPSKPVWYFAVWRGWLLLVTFLNDTSHLHGTLIGTISILAIILIVDFFSSDTYSLVCGLLAGFELFIYANLLSVLLYYPQGMYIRNYFGGAGYFLGYHNSFIQYVLPAAVVALLYARATGRKFRPIVLIAAGCMSILITWSATSICGIAIFGAVLLVSKLKIRSWLTFSRIFIVTASIDAAISVFRVMDRVPLISWIIESLLHKQITLTGRTRIWDSFYNLFLHAPWLGYGGGVEALPGTGYTAHNQWFQILLESGIIGLSLFLLFNLVIGYRLMQYSKSSNIYVFYSFLAAIYVIFIADVYLNTGCLYVPFIMAYHIDKFESVSVPPTRRLRIVIKRGYHVPNTKFHQKY